VISILAIDPGVTTGLCTAIFHERQLAISIQQSKLSMLEMENYLERTIELRLADDLHIVYEDFQYRNVSRTGLNLYPVKLIGVIELVQEKYPSVGFYKQSASTGKGYWSDEALREIGVYQRGTPHGRDAQRHLLHWLAFKEGSQYADINDLTFKLV